MFNQSKTVILRNILPLCFLVLTAIASSCVGGSDEMDLNIEYLPIQIEKDGYWSFVSKNGKIKYENEFKGVPSIIINGIFSVQEGEGYSVYKVNDDKPELIPGLENLKFVGIYNENLLPICFPNKRISIVNGEGKDQFELGPIKDKEIISCGPRFIEGMLRVRTEDLKEGFVNSAGECAIQPVFESVNSFQNGKAIVLKDSIWCVIDKKGEKIFSFKKGIEPISEARIYGYNQNNQIYMKDSEGRFYIFDAKGEMTKLSTKIKEIVDYYDKYIIYSSESGEKGMMTIDGEIIIRPKYKELTFGEKGELIASHKDNEWVLLDYFGDIQNEPDFSEVRFIKRFGYIVRDNSNYTIMNKEGKPIDMKLDFVDFSMAYWNGINRSCYIPSAKIVKTVMDMIKPDGIGDFRFDESMKSIAIAKGLTVDDVLYKGSIRIIANESGTYEIDVNAWSDYIIASREYNLQTYDYSPNWVSESRLKSFIIFVSTIEQWNDGVKEFEEVIKQKGYKEMRREVTSGKPAILLTNHDRSIIIGENAEGDIVLCYVMNMSKEFEDSTFDNFKTANEIVEIVE